MQGESHFFENKAELSTEQVRFNEIKRKYMEMIQDPDFDLHFYDLCVYFAKKLKDRQGKECLKCRLYHMLIGSTVSDNIPIERFDFTNMDSVEEFINQEYENYQNSKKLSG